jgi:hypothetical protein
LHPDAKVVVRLLIYSGRPDPEWHLSPSEVEDLAARLEKTLEEDPSEFGGQPTAGYRGFVIATEEDPLPKRWLVFGSHLVEDSLEARRSWEDRTGIESWLLGEAARRGFDRQLHALGVEV